MDDAVTLVVGLAILGGAVYLATREEAAPIVDDGPDSEATGVCGQVGAAGDKAGGYGLAAGPACGLLEKLFGGPSIADGVAAGRCIQERGKEWERAHAAENLRRCRAKESGSIGLMACVTKFRGYPAPRNVAQGWVDGCNRKFGTHYKVK